MFFSDQQKNMTTMNSLQKNASLLSKDTIWMFGIESTYISWYMGF